MGTYIGYFDGGSRGNPGPAAAGVCLLDGEGVVVYEEGRFLGRRTNNEAEYDALMLLLEEIARRELREVTVRGDSRLVVSQMRGEWKVREPHLQVLVERARGLIRGAVRFEWIPRERNARADALANEALDRMQRSGADDRPSGPVVPAVRGFAPEEEAPVLRKVSAGIVLVAGNEEYAVDLVHRSCTCPGFRFRGECRHLRAVLAAEEPCGSSPGTGAEDADSWRSRRSAVP